MAANMQWLRGLATGKAWGNRKLKNFKRECLIRGRRAGVDLATIAKVTGTHINTLHRWRKDRETPFWWPKWEKGELTTTASQYVTDMEVEILNGTWKGPRKGKRRYTLKRHPSPRVERILILRRNGMAPKDIAGEVGISHQAVNRALRTWKNRWVGPREGTK